MLRDHHIGFCGGSRTDCCLYTTRPDVGPPLLLLVYLLSGMSPTSGVISKLHYSIRGMNWEAIMSEGGGEDWTEHTALWCTCVLNKGGGNVIAHCDIL